MSLVGFAAKNHPQQKTREDVDDRGTPPELFDEAARRWGPFTIDVSAAAHNAKVARFYDIAADGLRQDWTGERVWCNPPFSALRPWVEKAWASDAAVVMLLPANRTEQPWWQDLIEPFRDNGGRLRTFFWRGRQRFIMPNSGGVVLPNQRPPFGIVFAVWSRPVLSRNICPALDRAHEASGVVTGAPFDEPTNGVKGVE